jgi:excisionase family DNA binding protein
MTLREAAELLELTPDTLRQQIHAGKIRARKVGPLWWVTDAEVDRYATEYRGLHGPRPGSSPRRR